jgi:integrase
MFTAITVFLPKDKSKRGYVYTRIDGVRFRFYNGKSIGIACFPNRCRSIVDKRKEMNRLASELLKCLSGGWRPHSIKPENPLLAEALNSLEQNIYISSYSSTYKRDLVSSIRLFTSYMEEISLHNILLKDVLPKHVEGYLSRHQTSGSNYMNKRRHISVIFSFLKKQGLLTGDNPVTNTTRRAAKAHLHVPYTNEQLTNVLGFLKKDNLNLYTCALIMYGSFLRPHHEIRLIQRKNISDDLSYFILDGYRNKNGSIRKAPTTDYIRDALIQLGVKDLEPDQNIFSKAGVPYNQYYFNLIWSRAKEKMLKIGLIKEEQTLYSFRHTAAINTYKTHNSLSVLQKLLAHSSLTVSLTYLRGLGQADMIEENMLPKL